MALIDAASNSLDASTSNQASLLLNNHLVPIQDASLLLIQDAGNTRRKHGLGLHKGSSTPVVWSAGDGRCWTQLTPMHLTQCCQSWLLGDLMDSIFKTASS